MGIFTNNIYLLSTPLLISENSWVCGYNLSPFKKCLIHLERERVQNAGYGQLVLREGGKYFLGFLKNKF